MKIILAVSGGIDSMVMLNLFLQASHYNKSDIIVAHFNHGTRKSAQDDADFVAQTAKRCGLKYVTETSSLGERVAEEVARKARYTFLNRIGNANQPAIICTAHHLDDLIESVAINFLRGTGWRGLAVLGMNSVRRPFLEPAMLHKLNLTQPLTKKDILRYAAENKIIFREDPTNNSENYLRNRIRPKVRSLSDTQKKQLYQLWLEQRRLREQIEDNITTLIPAKNTVWERAWFRDIDDAAALEILRSGALNANIPATKPQLLDFLQAIRTYSSGKAFNLPQDHLIKFSKTRFYL